MKRRGERILMIFVLFIIGLTNVFGQQSRSPGVDSVVITFAQPPVVTVQKAPLKYNKDFAMSFQMDDALSDIFEKVYPVFEGDGTTPGLTYTDGCGHSIAFKMASGVYIFSSYNSSDILKLEDHDQSKLTWPQLETLYRSHWGIENHGLFDNPDASSPEKIEYAFQRTKSYTRRKISDSITFKTFVIPNGLDVYVDYLDKNHYHSAINQGQDNSWIGYGDIGVDVESDTIDWLKPVKLNRLFLYSDFKKSADTLYAQSKRGIHKWLLSGMHNLPGSFLDELREIYNTYGTPGLDDILLAPDDEILDYLAVKQAVELHQMLRNNKLTLTFSGNVPSDRMYYALTLNIFANQPIEDIQVYGADNYSFLGVGKDTALINVSWNGRYYYSTEMLADSFTDLAMATGSQWKALVAMDYVEKLPSGEIKIRLKDSLCSLDQSGWTTGFDAGFCNLVHLGTDTTICPRDSLVLTGPENMAVYTWYKNNEVFNTSSSVTVFPDSTTVYALIVRDKSGNEMGDTINVTVFSVPQVQLGTDTGLCAGSCLLLTAPEGNYRYFWSTGDTVSFTTVCPDSDTTVVLTLKTADGCRVEDSVKIAYHLPPVINIPEDSSSHCFGDSVLLSVSATDPGLSYLWSTGDTSSFMTFLPAIPDTTYQFSVTATSIYGCTTKDTASVFVLPQIPGFQIGADTGLCAGSCISLNAPNGNYTYRWSTGDTAFSVSICPVSDTVVSLTVFTPELCSASDSVKIAYHLPPAISIPEDSSSHCFGDSVFLTIATGETGISYQWNTGDTTDAIVVKPFIPDTTYVYFVKAVSPAGCITWDTAHVFVLPAIAAKMDSDYFKTCDGQSVTVSCTPVQGDFVSYTWVFNGDTSVTENHFFSINNPSVSDWIRVTAASSSGCSVTDSAYLHTIAYPEIVIPGDTGICTGDSVHLSGTGGDLFYWLDGNDTISTDSVLNVRPSQETIYYALSGFDVLCMSRDSLTISLIPLPETKIIWDNTPVCMNTPLTLRASGADRYLWLPGNVPGDMFSITPADTLVVYLTGISKEGCIAKDSLSLSPAPLPQVHFTGLMPSYCENDPEVSLKGEPEGGVFLGDGITGSVFSPELAGPGNHAVFYTYTSTAGCVGKSGKETFVYGPVPDIHLRPVDTTLYPGGFIQYDAGPGFDAYYWTTGDVTQKIRVDYGDFPAGTDTIRVVGITGGCSSVGSAVITFGNPTDIIHSRVEPLTVYPNPAHSVVSVSFHGDAKPLTFEIFDVLGKRIYDKQRVACSGSCTVKINISTLKPGVYFVWMHNEVKSYFSKMVIQ